MELNNRIQEIVNELYKSSRRSFAIALGVSPATIDNILGARSSKPSADLLIRIKQKIDRINLDWLLTGEGEMLNLPQKENFGANNVYGNNMGNILSGSSNNVNYLPPSIDTVNREGDIVDIDKSYNPYLIEIESLNRIISQKDIIIEGKDILIAEKERLISVLLKTKN